MEVVLLHDHNVLVFVRVHVLVVRLSFHVAFDNSTLSCKDNILIPVPSKDLQYLPQSCR